MSIHLLAPEVIDQIAAGEVVERPAHMLKELIENSVDAGATSIEVDFRDGGKSVRVQDNGSGIPASELTLALARHATSKIEQSGDLWDLSSFGFRGEALASLAAVSRFTLTSRVADQEAYQIHCEFGKVGEVEASGGDFGTQVQIEDLFGNMPARKKFLKSDSAESTQIKNTLKGLALANPSVEFRIRSQEKSLFFWPAVSTLLERSEQVLEKKPLYSGELELDKVTAEVVVSAPHDVCRTRKNIWIFAQNRWIEDRSIMTATIDAYRSLLMHGEFPFAVVKLQLPPAEIDINIHPTKSQVKFLNPKTAFRVVQRAVRGVLEEAPWVGDVLKEPGKSFSARLPDPLTPPERARVPAPENTKFSGSEMETTQFPQKPDFEEFHQSLQNSLNQSNSSTEGPNYKDESELDSWVSNFGESEHVVKTPAENWNVSQEVVSPSETLSDSRKWADLQILGQANRTYIVAQKSSSLIFIDQHAAHERVAYESLLRGWEAGQIDVQSFLIPLNLDLDIEEAEALWDIRAEVEKFGVQLERMGPQTLGVTAAPSLLKESALAKSLSELAEAVVEHGGGFQLENKIRDLLATMACHSVVRAGQTLSLNEMKALLLGLDEFALSSFCPHGRPVFVEYPYEKLEKDFGRIV